MNVGEKEDAYYFFKFFSNQSIPAVAYYLGYPVLNFELWKVFYSNCLSSCVKMILILLVFYPCILAKINHGLRFLSKTGRKVITEVAYPILYFEFNNL